MNIEVVYRIAGRAMKLTWNPKFKIWVRFHEVKHFFYMKLCEEFIFVCFELYAIFVSVVFRYLNFISHNKNMLQNQMVIKKKIASQLCTFVLSTFSFVTYLCMLVILRSCHHVLTSTRTNFRIFVFTACNCIQLKWVVCYIFSKQVFLLTVFVLPDKLYFSG